ncbi:VanZ family protein [Microbacterium sp. SLBN-146]|uniref:VanZ family protein n=1 Tax=Microbacterium sp. SLBN-146 TaxID=2768457 RepID=UPI0011719D6F|nr:VanZ family protein [Microbacterium sp. SLBN-146]TQJ29708.1 VanZ like protein [Microbacterium sp. SLBN-146]
MDTNASATSIRDTDSSRRRPIAAVLLGLYALALAAIAFWPVPIDRGIARLLRAISEAVPWLTYPRIEFGANVAMFVPLGILAGLILRRRWILAVPLALAASGVIEVGQALFLTQRTASLLDVVANVLGAAFGAVLVGVTSRNMPDTRAR